MDLEAIHKAVREVQAHCKVLEDARKRDEIPYEMASVRNILKCLNYDAAETNQVLDYIHAEGFSYCLDARFPVTNEDGTESRIEDSVAWWGIDQLHSRMQCVSVPTVRS